MYDTVTVFRDGMWVLADSEIWERRRRVQDTRTGEVRERCELSTGAGLILSLHQQDVLTAERSLPKALTGSNAVDLDQTGAELAAAALDRELAEVLGVGFLPPVVELPVTRLDYCHNFQLGASARVKRALGKLAEVELPRKGRPVRGQSGSVSWKKGGVQLIVYDKHAECGEPAAYGVLRVEAKVQQQRTFRALLGRPASKERVSLREVMTEGCRARTLARYAEHLGGFTLSAEEIGDLELVDVLIRALGFRRVVALVGWCVLFKLQGMASWAELERWASTATRYRVLGDLRKARAAVAEREEGWGKLSDEEAADRIGRLSAHLRAA